MADVKYNRIQVLLVENDISQLELSEQLNVNRNSVSRWCRNIVQPSLYQLREIAEFFRVDIRLLIEPTDWSSAKTPAPVELYKAERKKKRENKSASVKRKQVKKYTKK